ncbi:MAG: protease complex subunit PrcB family protein [Thermosipho sp. (in: Bacteria)]|nr:protease complex subunit PrcB family protein [Thermosipho sp. (in: thermotogales)]
MKKFILIFIIFVFNMIAFSGIVYVHSVSANIPQNLFEYTGSRSNMIYYLELFNDGEEKGYLVSGWFFTPVKPIEKTKILIEYDNFKFEYNIDNKISKIYSDIPLHLIICPSNSEIKIGEIYLPNNDNEKRNTKDVIKNIPKIQEMGIFTFTIENGEVLLKNLFDQNEEIYILINAGIRKTGGFSIDIKSYEIKNSQIVIEGELKEPSKNEIVTQAFTFPSIQIKIGKLKPGNYVIKANIKNLGIFTKTIEIK